MIRRAFLGGGALAILASVGGSGSADGAVDDAETVAVVDASTQSDGTAVETIRDVDFGEVAQPGSACSAGLRFTPPGSIPVSGGSSQVLDLANLTQLNVDPEVGYGDLDGDGTEEAVVHVTCAYGANGSIDSVHVWSLQGDRLVHLAGLDEPVDTSAVDGLPPEVQGVAVTDGGVTVTSSHYADGDARCCPSGQTQQAYALDGSSLEPLGQPVTTPVRP